MTIENFQLSATMTWETWLCQSDDREIVFLSRKIVIFMTYDDAASNFHRPGCFITHYSLKVCLLCQLKLLANLFEPIFKHWSSFPMEYLLKPII